MSWYNFGMKRLAAGCVILTDNSILLLHRIDKDWWEVPGGKGEPDETLEQTAQREAREELGCVVRILRKLGKTMFNNFQYDLDYTWFLAEVEKGESPKLNEPKAYDVLKYIPIDKLKDYKLSPSAQNLLREVEKGNIVL